MADSGKAPEAEAMETSTSETSKAEVENTAEAVGKGTKETQQKTEKPKVKPASNIANVKKDSIGYSTVSPSYSQLQSGLQDIVKNYVASKSSTTNKNANSAKPDEAKKPSEPNGKRKNDNDANVSADDDRNFFDDFLDRTKSDYYCKVCDSHMNSEQMWENHVQGKRHLKNIKKDPGEPPSKVKAVRTDLVPKINKMLEKIREPIVGLDYMCELQRAESYLDPTYSCFLCHATCTVSSVVDHILGTKHRLAYLKEVSPNEYCLIEEMKLKKSGLTSIAEDYAREWERKKGSGRMEVKIEKPKMAPPPSKKERRYLDDDDDDDYLFGRRAMSPVNDWRRDRYSPPLGSMHSSQQMSLRPPSFMPTPANYAAMTMVEKLSVLRQVSSNLIVVSENEGREIMQIINSLTQSLLQYKIRVLPPQMQDTLARHIISGDSQGLENTLGLRGSGMSNVGSVINSMAASGNLPMRDSYRGLSPPPLHLTGEDMSMRNARRGLSPPHHLHTPDRMGGGPNPVESGRNPWGPPGPHGARMPAPMRGGFHGTSYPSTSQWEGGMRGGPFRGNDRSSLGY